MDADSDGHHIATFLLTFFYRYLRPLIDAGVVFIAQPPLYRVDIGKQTFWAADDAQKEELVTTYTGKGKVEIQRFKGFVKMMPATLFMTTSTYCRDDYAGQNDEMDRPHCPPSQN